MATAIATLEAVQRNFAAIHAASQSLLLKLTARDVKTDLILSAELSGLMLLRNSDAKIPLDMPGSAILGVIDDQAGATIHRFIIGYAKISGKKIDKFDIKVLTDDDKKYHTELTRFEQPFHDLCAAQSIEREFFPFVAAATAVKLMLAGEQLKILNPEIGLPLILFHIVAGGKTIPFPPAP